jgi:phosphomannomutase/phosphoglucomutase
MHVFGSSGVRGVAGEELTPQDAMQVAQAAGSVWATDTDRVAVARDTRTTGRTFANAVTSGFTGMGFDVDRLGIVPTPGLQAYCEAEGVPGLMVTASHNPPAYNGIKLIGREGFELTRDVLDDVERALAEAPTHATWDQMGTDRRVESARRTYKTGILESVDRDRIAGADLTVVVDPGHGAGALVSPELFRELGCTVHTVNAQPDGHFPGRNPEPVAATLGDLRSYVRATDADLGIAHDGDGDRAMFVDERGEHVDGSAMFAALAAAELEPGDGVVSAVNASQRLVDVVEEAQATLSLTPIGSTYIVSRIRERQAAGTHVPIAGEGNGGILFPDYRIARDGAYTAARFCELLADRTARELVAPYDDYYNVRRNLHVDDEPARESMLAGIESHATEAPADLDTTDGWRLDYGDGWVLARPSGTEPVVRVYAEARTPERAEELAGQMVGAAERGG